MDWIDYLILVILLPLAFFVLHRFLFLIIYLFKKSRVIPDAFKQKKFAILIPAHNEEAMIAETIQNLLNQNYPKTFFDIMVIADNCTDNTTSIANEFAVSVYERDDIIHQGKGYAIHWAINNLDLDSYDAVIINDADTLMSGNFLKEINRSLNSGSSFIQSYYTMSNPGENLFTTFFSITNFIRNHFCFYPRWKCGLSVPLLGSGMCFSLPHLKKLGWTAFSITEDHEFFVFLATQNLRVDFCPNAKVFTHHSTSFRQATSQRIRWYGGKFFSMYRYGFKLLGKGLLNVNPLQIDAGLETLTPHMSLLFNINLAGLILATFSHNDFWFILLVIILGVQFLYFGAALAYMPDFYRSFASIILVPAILAWAIFLDFLAFLGFRRNCWIRTRRDVRTCKNGY